MQKTDYEQIQELTARYAAAIDAKNYDAIEQCFTPDASVEYQGYSEALVGRAAIVAHMRRSLDGLDGTQHLFTNFVIDGEGDTARLNCDILAHHWRAAATGGTTFMAGGKYSVELKRLDGRWHFARLRGRTAWSEGNRNLLPRTG
jgi:ketosteroid isomerase-like protein